MSTHVNIFKTVGDITMSDVMIAYGSINEERFNGLLEHTIYHTGATLAIAPDKAGYEALVLDIATPSTDFPSSSETGTYIDMRHGHGNDFYWWLDELFTREFAKQFDAEIYDDGLVERMSSDYKDLSFQEWLKDRYNYFEDEYEKAMVSVKYLEGSLGSEFYHTFITETIPRRNDKIDSILND